MSRVELVAATVAAVMGVVLAGCSAMPSLPDWMTPDFTSSNSSAAMQPLRFESDPPGADVHTAQNQTCQTPCALAVPSESQAVTFTRVGYISQTIQVAAAAPPDHAFWESPPPSLSPNPVQAVLQPIPPPPPPPRKPIRHPPRKTVSSAGTRTRTAAKTTPPQGRQSNPFPDPTPMQQQEAAPSPFPPPPPMAPQQQ